MCSLGVYPYIANNDIRIFFKYFPTSISSVALASLQGPIARILCVLVVFAVQVIPAAFYNTQTPVYLLPKKKSIVAMLLTNDRQKKIPRVIKSSENVFRNRKERRDREQMAQDWPSEASLMVSYSTVEVETEKAVLPPINVDVYLEDVMDSPRVAPTAAETGVADRVGAALRLWAMCALTRCPAASAEHRLSSPARTAAATIRASWRALSPGLVG